MDLSYILNELGEERENYFNAISPPIAQTSNFAFKTVADLSKAFEDEMGGYLYSRGLNPTVEILRKKLAALDGAEDCLVFNSGAAAIFASIFANVKSGDHIVSVNGVAATDIGITDFEAMNRDAHSKSLCIEMESGDEPRQLGLSAHCLQTSTSPFSNLALPTGQLDSE